MFKFIVLCFILLISSCDDNSNPLIQDPDSPIIIINNYGTGTACGGSVLIHNADVMRSFNGGLARMDNELNLEEVSIGDFVLTNGELPTLVILDAIVRLIPGVLNDYDSAKTDSFFDDLLDGPHYTRPREFKGMKVPDILLSGNHSEIEKWFLEKKIIKTKKRRKDLYIKYKSKDNGE